MIQKSYSSEKQDDVSTVDLGNGFTEVWLRRNHAQDTADDGPDGEPREFWSCDEVCFTAQGPMTEEDAQADFDGLWAAHEFDGVPAGDIAKMAREEAAEAKEQASQAGGTYPQLAALASLQVMTMDLTSYNASQVTSFRGYWRDWEPGIKEVKQNDCFKYGGGYWRASQAIPETQAIYPPGTSESLYYPIEIAPDGIIVYRTCHGDYDMVHKGEKRHYPGADGPVYEAIENTSYSPDVCPDHWKKVEE